VAQPLHYWAHLFQDLLDVVQRRGGEGERVLCREDLRVSLPAQTMTLTLTIAARIELTMMLLSMMLLILLLCNCCATCNITFEIDAQCCRRVGPTSTSCLTLARLFRTRYH
jgi:hypothetical protein